MNNLLVKKNLMILGIILVVLIAVIVVMVLSSNKPKISVDIDNTNLNQLNEPTNQEVPDINIRTEEADLSRVYKSEELKEELAEVEKKQSKYSATSWHVYESSKNDFPYSKTSISFEYPSDWEIIDLPDSKAGLALKSPIYEPVQSGSVFFDGEIYINVVENKDDLSLEDHSKLASDTSIFWFDKYPYTEMKVNGREAVFFDTFSGSSDGSGFSQRFGLIKGDGFVISIAYIFDEEEGGITSVFKTIFNNIRILSLDTSDWSVYENSEYGFEIKYPSSRTVTTSVIDRGVYKGKNKVSIRSDRSDEIEESSKGDLSDEISILVFDSFDEINNYHGKNYESLNEYLSSGLPGSPTSLFTKSVGNLIVHKITSFELNEVEFNFIVAGSKIYQFSTFLEDRPRPYGVFDEIVKSFRLGSQEEIDISN